MRLAGAGASAPNLHRGDLSREPSEENRSAFISHLVSCTYLPSFARAALVLATCLQGSPCVKILTDANAFFKGDALTGDI